MSLFELKWVDGSSPLFTQFAEFKVGNVIRVVRVYILEYFERILFTQLHVQILKANTKLIEGYLAILAVMSGLTEFKSKNLKA